MNDSWVGFFGGVAITPVIVVTIMFLSSFSAPETPLEISGRVVEKTEAFTGYNNTVHLLRIEQAEGRYVFVVVTAQVWNLALVGVRYEFVAGGKDGYNSTVESVPE